MTLDQLRSSGRQQDIAVWPSEGPRWPGDEAPWRFRRGSIEVGSLACETEAECWRALLAN